MSEEKLRFMDMLAIMRVVDDDDRVRKFEDCVQNQFDLVSQKVAEYGRDGSLTIKIKFNVDKKSKCGVNISAEVSKSLPKNTYNNQFYRDARTGGFYLDNPDQLKIFDGGASVTSITAKPNEIQGKEV